jgi:murein DD-endopeptidase MepM/ murein hydrolase activator NlpD
VSQTTTPARPIQPTRPHRDGARIRVRKRAKLAVVLGVGSAVFAGVFGASRLESLLADDGAIPIAHAGAGAGGERLGPGVAPAVAADPVYPVNGDFDYGEADARFGASRGGRPHEGQDVFAKPGTELVAVGTGVVVDEASAESAYSGGRGNFIAIYSEIDDRTFVYFHMKERSPLREGDQVAAGDPVGAVGCTGSCWGNHLHFEVRTGSGVEGRPIDPLPLLRDWEPGPG